MKLIAKWPVTLHVEHCRTLPPVEEISWIYFWIKNINHFKMFLKEVEFKYELHNFSR